MVNTLATQEQYENWLTATMSNAELVERRFQRIGFPLRLAGIAKYDSVFQLAKAQGLVDAKLEAFVLKMRSKGAEALDNLIKKLVKEQAYQMYVGVLESGAI